MVLLTRCSAWLGMPPAGAAPGSARRTISRESNGGIEPSFLCPVGEGAGKAQAFPRTSSVDNKEQA